MYVLIINKYENKYSWTIFQHLYSIFYISYYFCPAIIILYFISLQNITSLNNYTSTEYAYIILHFDTY